MSAATLPRVVVVVPAHDEAAALPTTLASVRAQTRPVDRVVVVSDRSTDATVETARRLGADVVETVGNTGRKAGALNQALRGVEAENVLVLDAHDRRPDVRRGRSRPARRAPGARRGRWRLPRHPAALDAGAAPVRRVRAVRRADRRDRADVRPHRHGTWRTTASGSATEDAPETGPASSIENLESPKQLTLT